MRRLLLCIFIIATLSSTNQISAQSDSPLSQNIVMGLAELRADIFARKQTFTKRINEIIAKVDSSSLSTDLKKEIMDFIALDIKAGGLSNSLDLYEKIPKESPYKNTYIEKYIANNQDFNIDKGLISELVEKGIFNEEKKINSAKLEELIKDFEFLDVQDNDRVLDHNAEGGLFSILLGYCHENIDLTIRHFSLFDHYLALDRIDRYPNINNGNLIEFLNAEGTPVKAKDQKWDKIIVRQKVALESAPAYLLSSLHDNLSADGHLYMLHRVKDEGSNCPGYIDAATIIKRASRSKFDLVDSRKMGCLTYFKFKSIKNLK